jgi:hypothetical protein
VWSLQRTQGDSDRPVPGTEIDAQEVWIATREMSYAPCRATVLKEVLTQLARTHAL